MVKVRKLKPHERRLVKKVDFMNWKSEEKISTKIAVSRAIQKYGLKDHQEYYKYRNLCKRTNLCLADLMEQREKAPPGELRIFIGDQIDLIQKKLYAMGVLDSEDEIFKEFKWPRKPLYVERFLRRRLNFVIYHTLHMADNIKKAGQFIRDGHVQIGPEAVIDPAFLVTRTLEDYVTWSRGKIRNTVARYNETYDDYEAEDC